MIKLSKIEGIYNAIVKGELINIDFLTKMGLSEEEILELPEHGFVVKDDVYVLNNVFDLYDYGIKKAAREDYSESDKIFLKCYELQPDNWTFVLKVFLLSLNSDLNQAWFYLEKMYNQPKVNFQKNVNFYLFLFNEIMPLPEEYQNICKSFEPSDLGFETIESDIDKMKMSAFYKNFGLAQHQFREFLTRSRHNLNEAIVKKLLNLAYQKRAVLKNDLFHLLEEKKYEELLEKVESLGNEEHLNREMTLIVNLTKDLINIRNYKVLPEVNVLEADNYYEALKGHNYELALKLVESQKTQPYYPFVLYLLRDINRELQLVSLENNSFKNNEVESILGEIKEENSELQKDLDEKEVRVVGVEERLKSLQANDFVNQGEYYNITDIKEIANLLLSGMSIDEICELKGISLEKKLIIMLIFAREYFYLGNDIKGNMYLKCVQKTKGKTKFVNSLYEEIRKNKLFYQNRKDSHKSLLKD